MAGVGEGAVEPARGGRLTPRVQPPAEMVGGQFLQLDLYKLLEELGQGRVYEAAMAMLQLREQIL